MSEFRPYIETSCSMLRKFIVTSETKMPKSIPFNIFQLNKSYQLDDKTYHKYGKECDRIYKIAKKRYVASLIDNPDSVLQDIQEILNVLEKQDFLEHIQFPSEMMQVSREIGDMNRFLYFQAMAEESIFNCVRFISSVFVTQREFILEHEFKNPESYQKLSDMMKEKILEWYSFPESEVNEGVQEYFKHFFVVKQQPVNTIMPIEAPTHLTVFHGKAIDALATMNSKGVDPDYIGNLTIARNEVKLVIEKFNSLPGALGISTHKLLCKSISAFAEQNHAGKVTGIKSCSVSFPLKEYALQCGYDVEERPTNTPEEAKREKKRVKNTLDNFRKKIKKDMDLLLAFRLTWEENVKGKAKDFDSMHVIGRASIKKGVITIEFTASMAEYMIQLPLSQYPTALLSVDDRNPNAYNIGWKMSTHYNNDNNLIAGTANLLKVKTLLACTSLPDLEAVRRIEQSWIERIKEPFENSLELLRRNGVISVWRYSHSKGVEMTDAEVTNFFESYEEWANTLVYFELKEPCDHTERLARNADKKKAARERNSKRRKKKSDE